MSPPLSFFAGPAPFRTGGRRPGAVPSDGEWRPAAAGGGRRQAGISAAVENPEDERKPERVFGHRKVEILRLRCAPLRMTDQHVILSEAKNPPVRGGAAPDLSLRASAHTGVAIRPPEAVRPRQSVRPTRPRGETDSHLAAIVGHWFAMTGGPGDTRCRGRPPDVPAEYNFIQKRGQANANNGHDHNSPDMY